MRNQILIAAATDQELSHFFQHLEEPEKADIGRRPVVDGRIHNRPVRLLVTGPGIVNTVQAVTACIEQRRPAMVIQTGCAGAFAASGLGIGDVAVAEEEVDIHLGLEPRFPEETVRALPFALMMRHERPLTNRYRLNPELADRAFQTIRKHAADRYRVQKGRFITVGTITSSDRRAQKLYQQYTPLMEAMEGAGTALLSIHYAVPFLEIRSASNQVGKRNRSGWDLSTASERCFDAIRALIQSWGGNHMDVFSSA